MAKKNKKVEVAPAPVVEAPKGPTIVYRSLPNPAPVAISAPTPIMQINPIVQPIALVPYGTMNQPILQVEE
ncbi:MAG: hypothetical protein LBQ40_07755 [Clostridiales bacterium]|jgi:hypothetical protein|nr:hypothetical protein [Clostridiales bacterium]MDR1940661.1 hypothetical protein [Clostridiales bacterium]